jgi:hypothetical protein
LSEVASAEGVLPEEIATEENGMNKVLKVEFVEGGSQAESLGIRAGDVLASYDGTPVSSIGQLVKVGQEAGESGKGKVAIVISRYGNEMVLEGTPGKLGLNVEEVDPSTKEPATDTSIVGTPSGSGGYASDYDVAKGVSTVVAFVGWTLVAIGVIAALIAVQQASGARGANAALALMAVVPGVMSAGLGFLLVMGAQVTRAVVDTADYAREILKAVERRASG